MLSRARRAAATTLAPVLLVVALLGLVLLSSPVGAQEGDQGPLELQSPSDDFFGGPPPGQGPGPVPGWDPELNDRAFELLLLEIALLDHLDAFTGVEPPAFTQIHDAYGPWPANIARDDLVAMLYEVDGRLADTKADVFAELGSPPSIEHALDDIPAVEKARISNGDTGVVPSDPYISAFHELLTFGDSRALRSAGLLDVVIAEELPLALEFLADPADINQLRTGAGQVAAQPAGIEARPEAPESEPTDDGAPWLTILAIAGLGLLVGVALTMLLVRRRRGDRPASRDRVTELIWEAHRGLSGATEEEDVVAIGTATATTITDSINAYVFRVSDDGLRRSGTETVITQTALLRVSETAQPLLTELSGDAAIGTAAVCAVPLVSDATMAGILVARRELERPYGNDDRHRLELLAPALGGALLSADQLDSFENLAMVDGLTALGNRRRLDGDLETTLAAAVADGTPVAFAMIDVDHFKQFNDTHGHEAGDVALQSVARLIEHNVRASDVVYRYGGEEFSVLLPTATVQEAREAGERIRGAVERAEIAGGETQPGGRLTVSVGISTLEAGPAESLKTRADGALYKAKALGRNCSVLA
ncbi:MAG: hypothetical protein DHS20C19_18290 [Acidimicrobiales bacterium]|nr:MAG: hypothetical protein DHS20C19_18290 [Acidimicrobiales bacterium]